jgi:hypothetical protein
MSIETANYYGRLTAIVCTEVKEVPSMFQQLVAEQPMKVFEALDKYPEVMKKRAVKDLINKIDGRLHTEFSPVELSYFWQGYYARINDTIDKHAVANRFDITNIYELAAYLNTLDDYWDWITVNRACEANNWLMIDNVDDNYVCCDELGNALVYDFYGERGCYVRPVREIISGDEEELTEEQKEYLNAII